MQQTHQEAKEALAGQFTELDQSHVDECAQLVDKWHQTFETERESMIEAHAAANELVVCKLAAEASLNNDLQVFACCHSPTSSEV